MKIFKTILCILLCSELSFAFVSEISGNYDRYDITTSASDSISSLLKDSIQNNTEIKIDSGVVSITVSPHEASDARITLIQNSKIEITSFVTSNTPIRHDTIGSWNAPLTMQISLGNYKIHLHKEGFRDILLESRINKVRDSISIEMCSFLFLDNKRAQWSTAKWLSVAIAVGAGFASYYFNNRIDHYSNQYNNAYLYNDIQISRDKIHANQNYYKISSTIFFASIGCVSISWYIQSLYHD